MSGVFFRRNVRSYLVTGIGDGNVKSRWKKILLGALVIFIGILVVCILVAWAGFWILDKTNGRIVSSGVTRRYLLFVPKTYDKSKATPLVISLHPAATWPAVEMNISRWNELADERSFLVVYPEGTGAFFGGLGPGPQVFPMDPDSLERDVKFISDLIDELEGEYNVDANRIYINGMSNGGGMAFLLSCLLSERVAALGVVAGAYPHSTDLCGDSRAMPTVIFHGTADKFAPYQGGKSPIAPRPFANVPEWIAGLARRNQCKAQPSETRVAPDVRRLTYTNCVDNADVVLYTVEGGGHTWPGGKHLAEWVAGHTTDDISATKVMWEFFAEHPRVR